MASNLTVVLTFQLDGNQYTAQVERPVDLSNWRLNYMNERNATAESIKSETVKSLDQLWLLLDNVSVVSGSGDWFGSYL
jgi:hypothetical protein